MVDGVKLEVTEAFPRLEAASGKIGVKGKGNDEVNNEITSDEEELPVTIEVLGIETLDVVTIRGLWWSAKTGQKNRIE